MFFYIFTHSHSLHMFGKVPPPRLYLICTVVSNISEMSYTSAVCPIFVNTIFAIIHLVLQHPKFKVSIGSDLNFIISFLSSRAIKNFRTLLSSLIISWLFQIQDCILYDDQPISSNCFDIHVLIILYWEGKISYFSIKRKMVLDTDWIG